MKYVLGRTVIFCAALLLFPVAARADLITITISQPITGDLMTYDGQTTTPFYNKLLTYRATLTTEMLAACATPLGGCIDGYSDPWTNIFFDSNYGLTANWTIEGMGTYVAYIPYLYFSIQGPPEHPTALLVGSGGDIEGSSFPNPFVPNPNDPEPCLDVSPCPLETYTSGGIIHFLGVTDRPRPRRA